MTVIQHQGLPCRANVDGAGVAWSSAPAREIEAFGPIGAGGGNDQNVARVPQNGVYEEARAERRKRGRVRPIAGQ